MHPRWPVMAGGGITAVITLYSGTLIGPEVSRSVGCRLPLCYTKSGNGLAPPTHVQRCSSQHLSNNGLRGVFWMVADQWIFFIFVLATGPIIWTNARQQQPKLKAFAYTAATK